MPEVPIGKGVTGAGLEVALEATSQVAGFEGDVELHLPWPEIGGVATLAAIVLSKSRSQIGRMTGVAPAGILDAL